MAQLHLHLDLAGNRDRAEQLPGWFFPLPEDDTWSCDGTEEHSLGPFVGQNNSFDDEPMGHQPHTMWIDTNGSQGDTHRENCEGDNSHVFAGASMNQSPRHTTRVCRAASGSTDFSISSATSVGEQTRSTPVEPSQASSTHQSNPVAGDEQLTQCSRDPQQGLPILRQPSDVPAPPHGPCLTITGGASTTPTTSFECGETPTVMSTHFYASTTDLLLQNLSMVVGNLRQRTLARFLLDVRLPCRIQPRSLASHQRCCANFP